MCTKKNSRTEKKLFKWFSVSGDVCWNPGISLRQLIKINRKYRPLTKVDFHKENFHKYGRIRFILLGIETRNKILKKKYRSRRKKERKKERKKKINTEVEERNNKRKKERKNKRKKERKNQRKK